MSKRLTFLSGVALSLCMAFPLTAEETPSVDTVVATVNGTEITLGHMIVVQRNLPEQYRTLPSQTLFDGILNQLVQQTVLQQAGPSEPSKFVRLSLENERRLLQAGVHMEKIAKDAVTEDALRAQYEENYANAASGDEYNASHILVETEEKAKELIAKLKAGADFAELAKTESTGPSGPSGGSLGWFGAGAMVKPFEEAVMTLKVGGVSDPVQTQFGWHVIILNDKRPLSAPTFEEVRPELENEIQQSVLAAQLDTLTNAATIDKSGAEGLDPALIKQTDIVFED